MAYYVIVRGPLASGKTTIANRVADEIKAEYISIDRVLDAEVGTQDLEAGYISQKSFIAANTLVVPRAQQVLERGRLVVIDGNFYWQSQLDDLVQRLQFPNFVFTLKLPLEMCIARDRERGKTHGEDAVRAVYRKSTEFSAGAPIDAAQPLGTCVADILSYLPKSNV